MKRATLSKPHYSNIKMLSPDGVLMCRLSEKRAQWYVDRELAVFESPKAIRLQFTPNGLGANGHAFYTSEHNDICVVCGKTADLSRHHCVPYCFRKHFPEHYKVHHWHDIVLLCDDCHNGYEAQAHDIKHGFLGLSQSEIDRRKQELKVIKSAYALAEHYGIIPDEKRDYLLQILSEHLGVKHVTDDHVLEVALRERPLMLADEDWKRVVENLDDLDEFVRFWRKHFVDTMNPQHLPAGWSIDAPASRPDLSFV